MGLIRNLTDTVGKYKLLLCFFLTIGTLIVYQQVVLHYKSHVLKEKINHSFIHSFIHSLTNAV